MLRSKELTYPEYLRSFKVIGCKSRATREKPDQTSLCLLWRGGCGKEKSTDELIEDLKAPQEKERIIAVRLLPHRKGDAAEVVPALIEVLKDKDGDIRVSAALGLGSFGEQAKDAIPALQAAQRDRDARVREAAAKAVSRIDPHAAASSSSGQ